MPGLLQGSGQSGSSLAGALTSSGGGGIWSKRRDEITFDQIHKYWSALPIQARRGLLRIDKQTLFEQARKNLYCSRCNGLLLEGYSQIVMYGKSMQQQEGEGMQDPSLHSWGGLATTRDGMLTLLDYFLKAKSLRVLQDVFDNARARERERELLYPDACGGGGRGWISQGMVNYGRVYGMRDTCALHTARLSCDTLVDFWSALSDETRSSLLRMKEEDFMERLMYRFDSKRFCRDCRRNVILEFKELKELKRMRREPRCSNWFCVADTAFQYEVSWDAVNADWRQSFSETVEKYHHFEWAIGTGEGKSDILDFEDVGMNGKVQVNGLDLGGLSACYITLRAWKLDGRCTELCVKAHALNGQPCVHRKLTVGDGFVTITAEESIRSFFEHAEEVEEEEEDDSFDKDGNEFDGDGSRSQKHAKSPELAREFLLDAATVIFKEQVEKAFREGTARQNAHSMFVCLSLNLLEERIHVACKEIITLEKQIKLLEEEEKEKREEDERKERRRTREREKKFRRKERLKGREREREREHIEQNLLHLDLPTLNDDLSTSTHDDSPKSPESGDSISVIESGDTAVPASTISPDCTTEQSLDSCIDTKNLKTHSLRHQCHDDEIDPMDRSDSFILEQSKSSRRKLRSKRDFFTEQAPKWYDKNNEVISEESTLNDQSDVNLNGRVMTASRCIHGVHRPSKERVTKTDPRNCNPKVSEKFHCLNGRKSDRYEFQPYSYSQRGSHRPKDGYHNALETQRPLFQGSSTSLKGKPTTRAPSRDAFHMKQVWEPMDARKKFIGSNSDLNVTLKTPVMPEPIMNDHCSSEPSENACESNALGSHKSLNDSMTNSNESDLGTLSSCQRGFELTAKSSCCSKDGAEEEVDSIRKVSVFPLSSGCDTMMRSSSSDNCSSCLSEGGSSTSSLSAQNADSSSTSDSEDAVQQSAVRSVASDRKPSGDSSFTSTLTGSAAESCTEPKFSREASNNGVSSSSNKRYGFDMASSQQHARLMHDQGAHVPIFPSQTMGYINQSGFFWSASLNNGLFPYPQANQYVFPGLGNGLTQTSVLSVPQHSLYQAATVPHIASSDRVQQTADSVHPFERPCSKGQQLPSEKPVAGHKGSANDASKPKEEISSFSLFHFGGPVTGVAGSNVKAQASCSMEDATIVEYSLFAASGGVRFSFF